MKTPPGLQNQNNKFTLRTKDYSADNFGQDFPDFSKDEQFILQDFVTLYNQGLIERVDNAAILDIYGVVPGLMKLRLIGNSYFELLALNELPILEFNFLDSLK